MGEEIPGGLEELKGITWELLKLFSYEVRRRLPRSQRWEPCIKEGCDHLSTWNGVNCLLSSASLCQQHLLCSLLCPCALCWVCASRLGGSHTTNITSHSILRFMALLLSGSGNKNSQKLHGRSSWSF